LSDSPPAPLAMLGTEETASASAGQQLPTATTTAAASAAATATASTGVGAAHPANSGHLGALTNSTPFPEEDSFNCPLACPTDGLLGLLMGPQQAALQAVDSGMMARQVRGVTVLAISIRTSNFGWARPNRVVSQAVFQKFAAGHAGGGLRHDGAPGAGDYLEGVPRGGVPWGGPLPQSQAIALLFQASTITISFQTSSRGLWGSNVVSISLSPKFATGRASGATGALTDSGMMAHQVRGWAGPCFRWASFEFHPSLRHTPMQLPVISLP
jgi:hypothetical protein